VGIGGRVDENEIHAVTARVLDPIDDLSLGIALEAREGCARRAGRPGQLLLDLRQRRAAVPVGLAGAEKVQIGAVHHQYVLRHRPSGSRAWPRRDPFSARSLGK
jgi:hypothetical protein